jgi:2-keto-3-deoxy-L-rhamnonate aldolase RhmA
MKELPMMQRFRTRLLGGELLVGTMVTLNAPPIAELLAMVGYDWLFIDAEHGIFDMQALQLTLQAAGSTVPCLIRVAAAAETPIKQALDIGAAGIIVPQVNSAALAEQVVQWAKYSPQGTRGAGIARAQGYGLTLRDYIATANENTSVIIQAEHIDAVHHIEDIVRVKGIDAVFVGPYDLSGSLGQLGNIDHPDVLKAINHVTEVCKDAGMRLGIFGVSADAVRPYVDNGYTLVVAGVDTVFLAQAARACLAQLRP